MVMIEAHTDIEVPRRTAYDQWTQFESFPRFMSAVRAVDHVSPTVTRWRIGVGPLHRDFHAEILEQHPDESLRWRSLDAYPTHEGEVVFSEVTEGRTRVSVRIRLISGRSGPFRGIVERALRQELGAFKDFIEGIGEAGGAWRGTIHEGRVQQPEATAPRAPTWPHG
ncbi:SRPBCC family protein [Aeromicrobium sp. YIM 150415]|uniref:SRPBCC family protein n=2 Tax=Nocardioidaceae TaxID=85015 RepID=A0A554SH47_9ACTN|nr:SRPBCC family protein [Aeromicrobium sp. YIM 150415]TSD65661.1 SRPBCC family protein [Aeromicrobium piscarium]